MITVSFGTPAQATAVTSLAPSLAMPPASARRPRGAPPRGGDDAPRNGERVRIVLRVVVAHARFAAMQLRAAEGLRVDILAGRGLHQRRAAEKYPSLVAHDHVLIRHRRNVR